MTDTRASDNRTTPPADAVATPATDSAVAAPLPLDEQRPWYAGISGYQWLVLLVASAGWIFDIYENQIFVITRGAMLSDLLDQPVNSPGVKYYRDRKSVV